MNFPQAGALFASRYRVEDLLGSGGFSRVYRATQVDIGRQVALKILRPPIDHDSPSQQMARLESMSARFHREARMISQLRSPYTITMFDYGQTPDGLLFMVLEYVDGESLAELIEREGAIEPLRVVEILKQTLLGLHEAHMLGMLHRDIKPANIMVYEHLGLRDQVKLLDFGIVKQLGDNNHTRDLTDDSTLVGTPRYMSPEYIRGDDVAPNSDLYSLGLVAYELVTGTRAIQVDSSIQIISKHLQPEPFEIPAGAPVPDALRGIINAMLRKEPSERYQSGEDVLRDLMQVEQQLRAAMPPAPIALSAPVAASTQQQSSTMPVMLFGAGALLCVLIAGGVFASGAFRGGPAKMPPAASRVDRADHDNRAATRRAPARKRAQVATATHRRAGATTAKSRAVQPPRAEPLSITSTPSGATIFLNGEKIGQTPHTIAPGDPTVALPAKIRVKHGDQEKTGTLTETNRTLAFTLTTPARTTRKATRKTTRKATTTTTRTARTAPKTTERPAAATRNAVIKTPPEPPVKTAPKTTPKAGEKKSNYVDLF